MKSSVSGEAAGAAAAASPTPVGGNSVAGMFKKGNNDSKSIVKKLTTYILLFYVIYYILAVIMVGGFHVEWNELGRYPFRISMGDFNPADGGAALGAWLAMVLTYVCSLAMAFFIVGQTRKSWDYVVTTSLLHFVICCIVNQAFPVNWIWWITLIIASAVISVASEFTIYYLQDMREIKLDN